MVVQNWGGLLGWGTNGRIRPNQYNVPSARFLTKARNSLHRGLQRRSFLYKSHACMPAQVLGRLLRVPSTQELNFFHFSCKIQLFPPDPVISLLEFLADLNVLDSCYSSAWKMLCLTSKKSNKIANFAKRFNSGH